MPDPIKPTQEPVEPTADPVTNTKTVSDYIDEAAKIIESPQEPTKTPEEIAKAEFEDTPAPKPDKKKPAAAKPVPEPTPEPTEKPKLSKREQFMQKADAESAYRAKESKLKEREVAAQALENRYKDIVADPVAYLEKHDPKFFERMVDRYTPNGDTKKDDANTELRSEIAALKKLITGNQETQAEKEQKAHYQSQLNEGIQILAGEGFEDVHKVADAYEQFTGRPTDLQKELARVWIDFKNQYTKELTPRECCEILLEDAQAHLERLSADQAGTPAETPTKKQPPPTGTTLTQQQETLSSLEPEIDYTKFKTKKDLLDAVERGLEASKE